MSLALPAQHIDADQTTEIEDQAYQEDVVVTREANLTRSHKNNKMINQYEFNKRLGKGQHGDVTLCTDAVTGKQVVSCSTYIPSAPY